MLCCSVWSNTNAHGADTHTYGSDKPKTALTFELGTSTQGMKVETHPEHVVVHVLQITGLTRHLAEAASGLALLADLLAK